MSLPSRKKSLYLFIIGDLIVSCFVWQFILWRSDQYSLVNLMDSNDKLSSLLILGLVPIFWILFFILLDEYQDSYKKSRFKTLSRTFLHSVLGVGILYYTVPFVMEIFQDGGWYPYLTMQVLLLGLVRVVHLTITHDQVQRGDVGFNTLLIGNQAKAKAIYHEITHRKEKLGYNIVGYVNISDTVQDELNPELPKMGSINAIPEIIQDAQIEEVIIAIEEHEHPNLRKVMNVLFDLKKKVLIKIIPDLYDILLGKVKINYVYGAILIEVEREIMPRWQRILKRIFDIAVSILFLTLFWWLYVYIALRVKLSSPGPIFYQQERIGLGGKPFVIYKFRSMFVGAEKNGPQLSFEGDDRCTRWGAIMRKWRIDELPQFWNVLKGEMSLVGPRPERAYFIEKIMEVAPHYSHLLRIKPGITSWGQVKYGYASTVEEMTQRLKYDLLYVENRSFALDLKILFYTLLVLIKGSGK